MLDTMHTAYEKLLTVRRKVHNRAEVGCSRNQITTGTSSRTNHHVQSVSQNFKKYMPRKWGMSINSSATPSLSTPNSSPTRNDLSSKTSSFRSLFSKVLSTAIRQVSSFSPHLLQYSMFSEKEGVMIIPSGDYIDLIHLESYFNNNHHKFSREETISMFSKQFELLKTCITLPLSAENVDMYEFLALSALLLWESDLESEADRQNAHEEAVQLRNAIIRDLLYYYQSIHAYEDVALRLGKILSILPSIQVVRRVQSNVICLLQRASQRFREYIEMKDLLNLYALPKNLFDMFSSAS